MADLPWWCAIEKKWQYIDTEDARGQRQAEREHRHPSASKYMAEVEAVPHDRQWSTWLGVRPGPGNGRLIPPRYAPGGRYVAARTIDNWRAWWIIRHSGIIHGATNVGRPWEHYHYRLAHSPGAAGGIISGMRAGVVGIVERLIADGDVEAARGNRNVAWLDAVPQVRCQSFGYT